MRTSLSQSELSYVYVQVIKFCLSFVYQPRLLIGIAIFIVLIKAAELISQQVFHLYQNTLQSK